MASIDRTFTKVNIYIDSVDITDTWHSIKVYQSIDSPTWSCNVSVLDSTNMVETLPINHGSNLKIVIETMDGSPTDERVEFDFYIYKISNKVSANQHAETYDLMGVTKAFLLNNTVRVNEKFKSMKVTEVISDVSTRYFPEMSIDIPHPCDNSNDVLVNNWSPFITIGWLLKQAHKDSRADYMFFQSDITEFKVDSIESMYSDSINKLDQIITYKVENTDEVTYYNIIKHEWNHVDVQQNLQNGYYKSKTMSYDFLNKSFSTSVYSHGDDCKADLGIAPAWKDSLFDNSENSAISFVPKMPSSYENNTGADDAEKWLPSRRAVLQRLDSEKFSAQLRGSAGVYRWLGKHIYIDLPNAKEGSQEIYSRFRRGYYLITAIVHHLTPSMYVNNYEFVKMRVEDGAQ